MKTLLIIAGSDSSGGAGIQADIKTCEAFGVFSTTVLTVLTAQNTTGVQDVYEIEPNFVLAQLDSIFNDIHIDAIKVGALYDKKIIDAIKPRLTRLANLNIPIVIDPVCVSKAGSHLLSKDSLASLVELLDTATISTPNIHEAKLLFGEQKKWDQVIKQRELTVLIKNLTMQKDGSKISVDKLYSQSSVTFFETPKLESTNLHGTGCSFSSAIAANLALGKKLADAIKISKEFIYQAIKTAPNIGKGYGPINHKYAGEYIGKSN